MLRKVHQRLFDAKMHAGKVMQYLKLPAHFMNVSVFYVFSFGLI